MKEIDLECPYCCNTMVKGYLKTTDLNWIRHTSDSTTFNHTVEQNGGVPLNKLWIRWPVNIIAYRCEKCKKIIFSYDD